MPKTEGGLFHLRNSAWKGLIVFGHHCKDYMNLYMEGGESNQLWKHSKPVSANNQEIRNFKSISSFDTLYLFPYYLKDNYDLNVPRLTQTSTVKINFISCLKETLFCLYTSYMPQLRRNSIHILYSYEESTEKQIVSYILASPFNSWKPVDSPR